MQVLFQQKIGRQIKPTGSESGGQGGGVKAKAHIPLPVTPYLVIAKVNASSK